jgi:2-hydroxycyclohexanecarboxyl-CoA dehydrogenase
MAARVALITGAARGIGRATALALAAQGCSVAIADLREDLALELARDIEEGGESAVELAMDVTDPDSVREGIERVLVNCAGWDGFRPFLATDEEFWRRVISINYEGCLRTCSAVLDEMAQRGWGRVVNVSSDAARVGSTQEAVYAGAKAGVIAFTKTIAREFARTGITANVVCPGPTDTDLLAEMTSVEPESERLLDALTRAVPMRRLGTPDDVAAAIAFLASEQAGYITGQTLSVSGGLTMA